MALLSNINNLFSVDSTGAIEFSEEAGTAGYVLVSAGAGGPPVWTDGYGGNVTGSGTGQKVVKWTGSGANKETVGDGPITFATNDSTFAGTITSGALTVGTSGTSRFTDTSAFPLQLNRGLAVDVVGTAGTIFGLGAYSTGTTYIDAVRIVGVLDANGTDGDMQLQVLNSGTHTTALTLNNNNDATFTGTVSATEFDLPSSGMLDWANADARIVEGLVNNYSLSFQTWDGSALNTALRLDGNNNRWHQLLQEQ